jgi:hypothetical protein
VIVADGDNEVLISFLSPLGDIIAQVDDSGDVQFFDHNFVHPIPLDGAFVHCINESDTCDVNVSVFGF